jgi:multidrug efflux pump subunit AcrA (membrane-fusion protein)
MNAKVTITIDSAKNALTIPVSALQEDEDGSYFVEVAEDADNNGYADTEDFKKVKVTQGLLTDYYVQIESSEIKEGMFVVIPEEDLSDLEISDVGLF